VQVNTWTARTAPTYGYEFNDDTAPQLFAPPGFIPQVATHASEMQYLFGLPYAPFPTPLNADQQALADSMRAAWARFAAAGDPSTRTLSWPEFRPTAGGWVISLESPKPQAESQFSSKHHCSFWLAG
jgi:para-nitrobenzyl esterase